MNSVITWLLQRTTDGSTHLQVLIISVLLLILFKFMINTCKEIYVLLHEGEIYDSEEM